MLSSLPISFVIVQGGVSDSEAIDDLFGDAIADRQIRAAKMRAPIQERIGADEWVEAFDAARQKRYYYHKVTKETRWKRPQL